MSEIKWGIIGLGNIAFEFASAFKEIKKRIQNFQLLIDLKKR